LNSNIARESFGFGIKERWQWFIRQQDSGNGVSEEEEEEEEERSGFICDLKHANVCKLTAMAYPLVYPIPRQVLMAA